VPGVALVVVGGVVDVLVVGVLLNETVGRSRVTFLFLKVENLIFLSFGDFGPICRAKMHTRFDDHIRSGVGNARFLIGIV
jgi:hypothetical protein